MSTKAHFATTVDPAALGGRLRALRRDRRYSLGEVAKATGISKSFLSLVESGRSDITISRLFRLLNFYRISLEDLLSGSMTEDAILVRKGDEQTISSPSEGVTLHLLSANPERAVLPLLSVFAPGGRSVEGGSHEGEEFIHVLEGTLVVSVEGLTSEPLVLEAGDSVHYPATYAHTLWNPGQIPARVLAVLTAPGGADAH